MEPVKPADRMYYCCLAIHMRDGGFEFRGFRVNHDPRTAATEEEHAGFIAWALQQFGIKPKHTKDNGSAPTTYLTVWDTEAECKAAYDEMIKRSNAKKGAGPVILDDVMLEDGAWQQAALRSHYGASG